MAVEYSVLPITPRLGLLNALNTPTQTVTQHTYVTAESLLSRCLASSRDFHEDVTKWLWQETRSREKLRHILDLTILHIDQLISNQLDEILHHPRFQQLEASWRGLKYLADTEADYDEELTIKVKVLNISWAEVSKDVTRAIEFDQSQLFKRIYSDEFDTPGGQPFGIMLGDYQIAHRMRPGSHYNDIDILREISLVATAALCPFIAGTNSQLFGLDSMREFSQPMNLEKIFSQQEYMRWRQLRNEENTRFVGLTLPNILMRQPYRADDTRRDPIRYNETSTDPDKNYLWGNACYGFGSVVIRAFANTGWFADIRGGRHEYGEGGRVQNLEYSTYAQTTAGTIGAKPATNIQLDDFMERELSELGFIPLCSYHSNNASVFYSNSSVHKPPTFDSEIANTNAKLSSMIQYMLCVARFGHYIKVIGRDKIGSFISARDCQMMLQKWLNLYTTSSDGSSAVLKARYPLSESRVEIKERPGKPGSYNCIIYLKPHFQLDQLVSSVKLVTELAIGNDS